MGRFLLWCGLLLSACSGPSLVVVGEGVSPAPPVPEIEVVVVDHNGDPVADARVDFGGFDRSDTGSDGKVTSEWPRRPVTIEASAAGFHPRSVEVLELPATRQVRVALEPVVVTGTVTDLSGKAVSWAAVSLGDAVASTKSDGSFELIRALPGVISVSKAAFEPASFEWDGTEGVVTVALAPRTIKSVRAGGSAAGDEERWADLLRLAEDTEINAVVIDTKDEAGTVFYNTRVETAHEIGAVRVKYRPEDLLADLKERDLYAITRIVAFQDNFLGTAFPELAVGDSALGVPWETDRGQIWLDPTDRDSWTYPLALAEEACALGYDEIQFDYVRFPSDGPVERATFDGPSDPSGRSVAITGFLFEAKSRLNAMGCAVASDIFAVVLTSTGDQGLGQQIEDLAAVVDVISPMIYPSHYSTGWFGFDCPNDHPGEVVGNALDDGMPRIPGPAIVRPWIQDFTFGCGGSYGEEEVRSQIDAVEERDLGWILWNVRSRFTESALEPGE